MRTRMVPARVVLALALCPFASAACFGRPGGATHVDERTSATLRAAVASTIEAGTARVRGRLTSAGATYSVTGVASMTGPAVDLSVSSDARPDMPATRVRVSSDGVWVWPPMSEGWLEVTSADEIEAANPTGVSWPELLARAGQAERVQVDAGAFTWPVHGQTARATVRNGRIDRLDLPLGPNRAHGRLDLQLFDFGAEVPAFVLP